MCQPGGCSPWGAVMCQPWWLEPRATVCPEALIYEQ